MGNIRIDAKDISSLADLQRLKTDFSGARGSHVTVDLSQVKKMSMLLLQVLLAARESFKASGTTLAFTVESQALLDTLTSAGLGELRKEFAMGAAT